MDNLADPILFQFDWPWRVTEYTVRLPDNGPRSLSLTFRRGAEARRLRFVQPYPLEGTFENNGEMESVTVRDVSSHRMESVRVKVDVFGYCAAGFWADSVEEETPDYPD